MANSTALAIRQPTAMVKVVTPLTLPRPNLEKLGRQDARNCLEKALRIIASPCTSADYREATKWIGRALWHLVQIAPIGAMGLRVGHD